MKAHWYSFTFYGCEFNNSNRVWASTRAGYPEKNKITMSRLAQNKLRAGLTNEAVLISINYLGHMTKEKFQS